ncbi:MAG TPA: diacylglycerol kinase family protein [Burkholderiales bacterium]
MSRHLVILNPAAGRGRARREWPRAAARLRALGLAFDLAETHAPGEGILHAERAAGEYETVIAAGGDGTIHEVVNGLMRAGGKAALGIVPLGSGDDFLKVLPPRDPIERIASGVPRALDVGRIRCGAEVRWFANGMDIGFGAHGARNLTKVPAFLTGLAAYLGALVLTMVRYPRLEVTLQLDDGLPEALATSLTAVMNGSCIGGSFRVCPGARPDDSELDLLIARDCSRLDILALAPKIMRGTHAGDPRLRQARARRVRIESAEPLLVEADGEIVFEDARRLDIEALPGRLRVIS